MAGLAYSRREETGQKNSPSRALLDQLISAHDQLGAEIENMDRITRRPHCELEKLTTIRWRISQSSLMRRRVASRVIDFLVSRPSEVDLPGLKRVTHAGQEMMRRSAAHVRAWTTPLIRRDWAGYCDASRDIRTHMDAHILLEKQQLYPPLERFASRGI